MVPSKSARSPLLVAFLAASCLSLDAAAKPPAPAPDFGSNVKIFDPSMSVSSIKTVVDAIATAQVDDEFGTGRWALLFKPGTYGSVAEPLTFQVGYGTEVAGLGASPTDVTIVGHVDVYNRCLAPNDCHALVNFWRSLSNLTVQVAGLDGCRASGNFWAASKGSSLRRVQFTGGNLTLMDYCTAGPQYSSGAFAADSKLPFVINGSQQQAFVRDSSIGGWSNGVWNQVFAGVTGAPAQSFPNPSYTTLATDPVSKEKPYLYLDGDGKYAVFVPGVRTDSQGTTWETEPTAGRSIPISGFYVARPTDTAKSIAKQLARGKHLLLTPGVYSIDQSLFVQRPGTVVLGLGFPTLTAVGGAVPLRIADVDGVDVSGIIVDAGSVVSPKLVEVGPFPGPATPHSSDPIALHDVFFRVGGAHAGVANVALEVNSDGVILDDVWAWRADHGTGASWTGSTAAHGVVVNGRNVVALGLSADHFQEYQTVWNGDEGHAVFFAAELPADMPDQASWGHDGEDGWAAYKVGGGVLAHGLAGGACISAGAFDTARGFEVPETSGVTLEDLSTVATGSGVIARVVNDTGAPTALTVPSTVVSYP